LAGTSSKARPGASAQPASNEKADANAVHLAKENSDAARIKGEFNMTVVRKRCGPGRDIGRPHRLWGRFEQWVEGVETFP
jgi:hypothetical protein